MKNLKVAKKLIISFLIVVILTGLVGGVGIVGMLDINKSMSEMYDLQTVPMPYMAKIMEMMQRQRACVRDMIIGAATNDTALIDDAKKRADGYNDILIANLDPYRATIKTPAAFGVFDEARRLYETDFMECKERIYELAKSGADEAEMYAILTEYTDNINKVVEDFDSVLDMKVSAAGAANDSGDKMFATMMVIIIVVLAAAIIVALVLAFYISGLISKPLSVLSSFMSKAGATGNIAIEAKDAEAMRHFSQVKDEIGETIKSSTSFINHVTEVARELESIASGDLTVDVHMLSDADTIGNSMKNMVDNLNSMFSEINSATEQVSTGAKQIADGAQSLAQGSTEQAASVQELSASISDIAEKTKANAKIANRTAELASTIMGDAEKGNRQMDEMIIAVRDISDASHSISKIIKTIDDIAFQTNILALNAAVEAARAGQHGKGFAVVAEEVRSLAAKSAEAAKETGAMIQNSMDKAELGSQIAGETAESLKEIVSGINESSQLIGDIAVSSEVQSNEILQINVGIDQVAQVIQQNSATAEESAAASEEMSSQSSMLQELASQFKLKDGNSMYRSLPSKEKPSRKRQEAFGNAQIYQGGAGGNFGKY